MRYVVVLNLGNGTCQQGFPLVLAQLWQDSLAWQDTQLPTNDTMALHPAAMQFTGSLPPVPELVTLYQRWQRLYATLYADLGWRSPLTLVRQVGSDVDTPDFDIEDEDETHLSRAEFDRLCRELQQCLNHWLNADSFRNIDRKLRTQLAPTDDIRFLITAAANSVMRLPWCLWHFFEDYPHAELALSPPQYARSLKVARKSTNKVKILAILGDAHSTPAGQQRGIDVSQDQALLQQLPHTELKFLVEPGRSLLTEQLWDAGWDILFFAGHSSSQGQGQIQVNPQETLTIEQLKFGLRRAIANGLKLAIFNSCDGFGLARDLADLHIPQVIVMREPVPDRVAQEFLKHFLTAYAGGRSLYAAVREAREKLQAMENTFPCATWLPVICQNPAAVPVTWQALRGKQARQSWQRPTGRQTGMALGRSVAIALLVLGVRWFGILQPMELWAFDRLLRLRPAEPPDRRLVLVTVTEQDIQAQGTEPRLGSLSDRTLHRLLTILERAKPAAIGLDVYRDFPVSASQPALKQQLQRLGSAPPHQPALFTICKRPYPPDDLTGIAPPPEVAATRIGFSDFVEDGDGSLRRHLLAMSATPVSASCTAATAFSVRLAFHYLQKQSITATITADGSLKLGDRQFPRLPNRAGGYQPVDASGSQILLNYRASPTPQQIATPITLTQLLSGQVNPAALSDRIVLIGITLADGGDYWATPFGSKPTEAVSGVVLQAQMVSQLLSAALDHRPLLTVWSVWGDGLWIIGWAIAGGAFALCLRHPVYLGVATGFGILILSGLSLLLLVQGVWVPLIPAAIALGSTIWINDLMLRLSR